MLPDTIWQSILEKGGVGGAIALALFFVLGGVIKKLWTELTSSQVSCSQVQKDCDEKIRMVYERQITTMMDLITTMNRVVDKNSTELAENTRVVESRAEAIRMMSEAQAKLLVVMDSYTGHMKEQANRMERNQATLLDLATGRIASIAGARKREHP